MRQDALHRLRGGDEGDEAQLGTAMRAEQRVGPEQPRERDDPVAAGGARAPCIFQDRVKDVAMTNPPGAVLSDPEACTKRENPDGSRQNGRGGSVPRRTGAQS